MNPNTTTSPVADTTDPFGASTDDPAGTSPADPPATSLESQLAELQAKPPRGAAGGRPRRTGHR